MGWIGGLEVNGSSVWLKSGAWFGIESNIESRIWLADASITVVWALRVTMTARAETTEHGTFRCCCVATRMLIGKTHIAMTVRLFLHFTLLFITTRDVQAALAAVALRTLL